MKRLFFLLLVLFGIYYLFQIGFKLFTGGHQIKYTLNTLNNSFTVEEVYTQNVSGEEDNYYFNIQTPNGAFDMQTYNNFNKMDKIIENIYYYKADNYECILPIFKGGKIITDVMCRKNNNELLYYYSIQSENSGVDNFVNSLGEYGYKIEQFSKNETVLNKKETLTIYDNLIKNSFLAFENYKGIYTANLRNTDPIVTLSLFENDIYKKGIHFFYDKYYITADYANELEFHDIVLADITNNQQMRITCNNAISLNSYIEGGVGDSVYLFDVSNKKQYEIDLNVKTITEIGNADSGIKYYSNGSWSSKTVYEAADQELLFNNYTVDNVFNGVTYSRIDKVGNSLSGFYYFYKKEGNTYRVYRSNVQNNLFLTYLFSTDDISKIVYEKDYIYYTSGTIVYYFNQNTGVKTIASNGELQFNKSLIFGVYIK